MICENVDGLPVPMIVHSTALKRGFVQLKNNFNTSSLKRTLYLTGTTMRVCHHEKSIPTTDHVLHHHFLQQTRDADGTLHLSCDVIELGRGDFLVVRSDAGGRETFHSHVKSIETSAAGAMQVEFRSDRDDEGRLHCSVRAVAGVQSEAGPETTQDGDKAGAMEVDVNYPDCGKTKFNTRIVGGSEPPPHSFPWLVSKGSW